MFKVYIDENVSFTIHAKSFSERKDSAYVWFLDENEHPVAVFSVMEVVAVIEVNKG